MSSVSPSELSAAAVIAQIESGAYPTDVIGTIARGYMPLEQDQLVAVLAYLSGSADGDIAALARETLNEVPSRAVLSFAANENAEPAHLALLTLATADNFVLEALIRNRAVSDQTITELAHRATPAVQEVIVINQFRILRSPQILEALLANPALSPDVRRRALETREEFFDKKARIQEEAELALDTEEAEPEIADLPDDEIADLLAEAAAEGDVVAPHTLPELTEVEKKEPKNKSLWGKIQHMTISEKVQLAFKGDKMIRMILVRERNKLVAMAAMRNPRMTATEAEAIAGMRNVEESVLRQVGSRRDWMSKYPVVIALCRNPKAPLAVVLPLINRLTLRDLKSLKDDKGVAEAVRLNARKYYQARQKIG
ncbi:MAG TPA: hypothetical protein VMU84_13080 [Thermoanaerobaculia bacterium]|nr:hypothetical protein [Thermoanaerobaculia bacterium]